MTADEAIAGIHDVAARRMEAYRHARRPRACDRGRRRSCPAPFAASPIAPRSRRDAIGTPSSPTIQNLRTRLDQLRQQAPFERFSEIDHYWDVEHTTSHSLLRDMGRTPP